jgi:hypothetical protein
MCNVILPFSDFVASSPQHIIEAGIVFCRLYSITYDMWAGSVTLSCLAVSLDLSLQTFARGRDSLRFADE